VPSPVLSAAPPAPLTGAPTAGAPAAPPPEPTPADVLATLDVGVACVAPDWRVTFVNPAWCEAMGAEAADFVGVSLWAALPSLAAMPEAAVLRATRADGVPRGFRVRYHDARVDGTFDLRVRRATEGAVAGALVLAVANVTARERLEQVQDRLLESVGDGLLVVAADWTVTYVNAAAERATGFARARVLGRPLWEAFPALVGSQFEAAWRDTMAGAARTRRAPCRSCGARAWSPSSTPRATRCPTAACSCCSAR
jgi:PAS domain-containing protein